MVVFAKAPILAGKADAGWEKGDHLESHGTQVSLMISPGVYLSVQPDGSYQTRPSGGGPWESFDYVANQLVSHNYDHGEVWVIPCLEL
jgi:hypothetical protein